MIVQSDLFFEDEADANRTFCAVKKHFPTAKVVSELELLSLGRISREPFRGSMILASKMGETFPFTNALNWMPALRDYLVSDDYNFLDFKSIVDRTWARDFSQGIFVRPCSGLKQFSGQVFTSHRQLENEYLFATKNKNIDPYLTCVCASAKKITEEYRCVFVNRKLVDACQYLDKGERVDRPFDSEATRLAEEIARNPYFDNIFDFVIDVGYVPGDDYKLIEINAFETASFYTCDLDKIYRAWAKSLNDV